MPLEQLFTSRKPYVATQYVAHAGIMFYDVSTGALRIGDGVTPGGNLILPVPATPSSLGGVIPGTGLGVNSTGTLSLNVATTSTIGGIKAGPGVIVASDGTLLINSSGLSFNFGDFYANANSISVINADENFNIVSNGTGNVNVVGSFNLYQTNTSTAAALASTPIFSVSTSGNIVALTPNVGGLVGAFQVIGNSTGIDVSPNQTGVILHVTGGQGLVARNYFDAADSYSILAGRRYNGTPASPTGSLNNDIIFRIVANAATTTGTFLTYGPARISFYSNENQTTTSQGGRIGFEITKNGTVADSTGVNTISVVSMDAQNGLTAINLIGPLTGNVTGNINGTIGTLTNLTVTNPIVGSISGNAATATTATTANKLTTATTINTVSFDGSTPISFTTDKVNEGTNNLYYTVSRVSALIVNSLTSYTTTTGVNVLIANSLTNYVSNSTLAGYGYTTPTAVGTQIANSLTNYSTTTAVNALIANSLTNYTTTATVNTLIANSLTNFRGTASNIVVNSTGVAGTFLTGQVSLSPTFPKNTTTLDLTASITGLTTSHKVIVTPAADMTYGYFVSAAYPSSSNTLTIQMQGLNNGAPVVLSTFNLTYFAWL